MWIVLMFEESQLTDAMIGFLSCNYGTERHSYKRRARRSFQSEKLKRKKFLLQAEVEQCSHARRAAIYANDFGCSLEQLGVRECIQEAQQWIYGDTYLILDRPLSAIIDYLTQGLKVSLMFFALYTYKT